MILALDCSVRSLPGVGRNRAADLTRLGIETVGDLLHHYPRDYFDARVPVPLASVAPGRTVSVEGEVRAVEARRLSGGGRSRSPSRSLVSALLDDGTAAVELVWFNQPWVAERIRRGVRLRAIGAVARFGGRVRIAPSEFEPIGERDPGAAGILPVYPLTGGITQKALRGWVRAALDRLGSVEDPLSAALREEHRLPPLGAALADLHFPATTQARDRARRRFAWEELFWWELRLARKAASRRRPRGGIAMAREGELVPRLGRSLPYELTRAQRRVLTEIYRDMRSPQPMSRLLQGDVGSGKTIVALLALLRAIENGCQGALMAPTEILAEQHARKIGALLDELPVEAALLTGRVKRRARERVLAGLASGEVDLVLGTHALIQEGVRFRRLGLAIVDEQHRFGVEQRLALARKGRGVPDLLVMTATPIPRSLALTFYGDLDVSRLDELPPGRMPIATHRLSDRRREDLYRFLGERLKAGEQGYVVYPLVEESEALDLQDATGGYERLAARFPYARVALLHGRMSGEEKDRTMRAFAAGEVDLLVATTVIEVGVDVPNATVLVVEHAERFGLAQLHQLRGRIGRGAASQRTGVGPARCFLMVGPHAGTEARARLRVVARQHDGFVLAEEDLRLRGQGDVFGTRQHGSPEFRIADLARDFDLLVAARDAAFAIADADPALEWPDHAGLARRVEELDTRDAAISRQG